MHFYCITSCEPPSKAQTDVRASRNHLGSELQRLLYSVLYTTMKPESCIICDLDHKIFIVEIFWFLVLNWVTTLKSAQLLKLLQIK